MQTRSPTERAWRTHLVPLAILALVLLVSLIVRIRLLNAPLERDEGEHAYLGQALLAGYAPWQIAYNLKLPGTDAMYAFFLAVFGQTASAIRLGLLLVNTATIILIALLGKRLFGVSGGAIAGASYAVMSFSRNVFGTIAHSTHFVVFFAVLATLLLLIAAGRTRWLFLSGIVYGVAFLMKQPGIAFAAFGALFIAYRWRRSGEPFARAIKGMAAFVSGVMLPYGLLCLALWRAGTFPRFWFWTVTLARAYAGKVPWDLELKYFQMNLPSVIGPNFLLWALSGAALAVACLNRRTRRAGLFVGALLLLSFLAVSAGGSFNPNYFIFMLPAVALGNGLWLAEERDAEQPNPDAVHPDTGRRARQAALSFFFAACLCSVAIQRDYLFAMSSFEFERSSYGLNPFPEAVEVASYIRSHSDPGARIAVLGSEAEIYFYAHRQAATGYLFTYGLMETHEFALPGQLEMIHEIESARPQYIVVVSVPTSWLRQADSPTTIYRWLDDYCQRNFSIEGIVDLLPEVPATYVWGPAAASYQPQSPAHLILYRRKS